MICGYVWGIRCRSQWPPGLRRRSTTPRLLRSSVRIPRAWIFVCCECCVLSGRGLCDELITRPEESYRLCWIVVCDLETWRMRRPWPALGRSDTEKKRWIRYPHIAPRLRLRSAMHLLLHYAYCGMCSTTFTFTMWQTSGFQCLTDT